MLPAPSSWYEREKCAPRSTRPLPPPPPPPPQDTPRPPAALAPRRHREAVHGDESRLQELLDGRQLLLVVVDEGQRRVGGRETVRMHLTVLVPGVLRVDQRHVTAAAGLRLLRVVEGARPLARDAARLPGVVVVEAAEPAVVVDRHVEMHLVAAGAELRAVLAHERLHEGLAVRLGVEIGEEV